MATPPSIRPPVSRRQGAPGALFAWGVSGAEAISEQASCFAVADVLSFTTAVCVAAARDTEVFPSPDAEQGRLLAEALGAELAVNRGAVTAEQPWSLSPVHLASAPAVPWLVVPSPNGAAVSVAVSRSGLPVLALSLRNPSASVRWLVSRGFGSSERPVAVIAAGERWPDGTLRPAIEDLFGAGLVLEGLAARGVELSPEAYVAARAVAGLTHLEIADLVRRSWSGVELTGVGFSGDVEVAVEVDADGGVAVMWQMSTSPSGFRWDSGNQKEE